MSDVRADAATDVAAGDPAAAFDAMRRQLALLNAAVEGFAARQDVIAARDYAPDLARLIGAQNRVHEAVNDLAARPAMELTPQVIAAEIEAAAVTVRRADHEALTEAARRLTEATRQVDEMVARARTGQEQLDGQIWSWLFGAGTVLTLLILPQLLGVLKG